MRKPTEVQWARRPKERSVHSRLREETRFTLAPIADSVSHWWRQQSVEEAQNYHGSLLLGLCGEIARRVQVRATADNAQETDSSGQY